MVDAADLKSADESRTGSNPVPSINLKARKQDVGSTPKVVE